MKKPISVNKKIGRGRPKKVGGSYPVTAVRLPPDVLDDVDAWAASNDMGRSDALRRLVEIGLGKSASVTPTAAASAERAKELAGKTVDRLIDPAAAPEEKAARKRRLVKGPAEFQAVRVDRAGKK
ncbi:hypothetical protein [Bradyrhizobium genosp. P]|uniref:hypothetical protein n=1 Tax=Bradyrhizobium genosp. P TaxID=83641 RepID=UPI003CE8A262